MSLLRSNNVNFRINLDWLKNRGYRFVYIMWNSWSYNPWIIPNQPPSAVVKGFYGSDKGFALHYDEDNNLSYITIIYEDHEKKIELDNVELFLSIEKELDEYTKNK